MTNTPDAPEPTTLETMLCFEAYAVNLAFGRIYKPLLNPLGITYPQFLVMMILWADDGQSVGAIGDRLGLDSSTLTPLIKRLESADLVTRVRDTRDERRVIVSLTPNGAALEDRAKHVIDCIRRATGLNDREHNQLLAVLRRARAGLMQSQL